MCSTADNKVFIKSPAKINLHLEVIGKRKDNFHELAMIMQSIDLYDFLEIELNNNNELFLTSDCKELAVNEDNLIIKAGLLLKNYSMNPKLGAIISLKKNIPIGAGLAGGSSNAAAALVGLNKLWNLNFDSNKLLKIAGELGSDVPFCINGGFQFCFGKGEQLEKHNFTSDYGLILIKNPNVSISTPGIYKKYSLKFCQGNSLDVNYINERRKFLRLNGIHFLNDIKKMSIRNDLQKIVIEENKSVRNGLKILTQLDDCLCSSMSGSGPSCFALFQSIDAAFNSHEKNKKKIKEAGYESWVCQFVKEGISIV
ncbi:MAG: 4-(cytidine 5'-diphospho)-2-C-methyl-D-erythritol kinase [Prochlorococcus sp. SP3034]|nr:4-(cytidine 5'-diphospho)-2-C-methyl-D-erythritol kinase [Prochlorococcus sp. SP3034]|tara:strand:- start:8261 stop:9196 length:936 start_codon:yes stop_codon:yes gene_type:complete